MLLFSESHAYKVILKKKNQVLYKYNLSKMKYKATGTDLSLEEV